MNKTEFVEKVVSLLEQGSTPMVNERVAKRLVDARVNALRVAQRREAGGLGAWAVRLAGALSPMRAGFAGIAVAAIAWGIVQWQNRAPVQPDSIDLALLVDDAPLSAYTRPDFDTCLNNSC